LRALAGEIDKRNLPNVSMRELSMGMSNDFEVAIEEGARWFAWNGDLWQEVVSAEFQD